MDRNCGSKKLKVCYINTLNYGVSFWRIESYAQELLKFPDRVRPFVEYFIDPREEYSWESICLMDNELGKIIQDKMRGIFNTFDIVVIQKLQSMDSVALIKKISTEYPHVRIVAEVDDSIGDITPSNLHMDNLTIQHQMAAEHVLMSDAVIVSTEYLKNEIRSFCDKPIYVAPNCINHGMWSYSKKFAKKTEKRVGYVAGGGHDEDMLILYRGIKPLLDGVKLVIRYGGFRPKWMEEHKNIDFKQVSWNMDEYPQKVWDLNLDLMVAPLRDREFNRCKSNLKWIESSSMGITLLASDVEPYRNTNGSIYLTGNDINEWTLNIENALKNPFNKKALMSQNASNYCLRKECDKLITWFEELIV